MQTNLFTVAMIAATAAAVLTGCAGRTPAPVSAVRAGEQQLTCVQIDGEVNDFIPKVRKLSNDADKAGYNAGIAAVGAIVFLPRSSRSISATRRRSKSRLTSRATRRSRRSGRRRTVQGRSRCLWTTTGSLSPRCRREEPPMAETNSAEKTTFGSPIRSGIGVVIGAAGWCHRHHGRRDAHVLGVGKCPPETTCAFNGSQEIDLQAEAVNPIFSNSSPQCFEVSHISNGAEVVYQERAGGPVRTFIVGPRHGQPARRHAVGPGCEAQRHRA